MPRERDRVDVEVLGTAGVEGEIRDRWTSLQITQDITAPIEAAFELGDDRTWDSLQDTVAHGKEFRVKLNGRPLMTGRVEANDVPFDTTGGAVVRLTIRTKLSDAMFASADPKIEVKKSTTLLDFLLAIYEPLGYVEADFVGRPHLARNLVTGVSTEAGGDRVDVRFNRLKIDEARIRASETIYAAADRHLRRFGLMHWDSPDGKIVVGFPNDAQDPIYSFNAFRESRSDVRRANNIIGATRAQDWSQVPTTVEIFGFGTKRDFSRTRVRGEASDFDVIDAGFHRPVTILAEGLKNEEAAVNAAHRELAARRKQKDVLNVEVDGLSYWDGTQQTNYAVDTVANLQTDVAGGSLGAFYLHRVEMTRDASGGDVSRLSLLRRGLWQLFPDIFEGRVA